MPKVSLAKLERHLYAAGDILRGQRDATEYKDYTLGIRWEEHIVPNMSAGNVAATLDKALGALSDRSPYVRGSSLLPTPRTRRAGTGAVSPGYT